MTKKVSIIGGSGYTGGELIRLLLFHPNVEIQQVTSQRYLGKFVHNAHPNLRGQRLIKFTSPDQIQPCDILFLALPHKTAARDIERYTTLAEHVIDLSADFRLRDAAVYKKWYGEDHAAPTWLDRFVYGLPELHREELASAKYISGVGCNATAVNLALYPLAKNQLIDHVVAEVKVGSSEGGNSYSLASHHPERSGAVRSFAPTTHRHQAEMQQELNISQIYFSATAIEMVRGVMCTAHCFLKDDIEEKEVWKLYRKEYKGEPFIRLVKDNTGIYRFPEPKILQGTNYCDIGFAKEKNSKRLVVISAIDNLMKGAAGSAVQSMNVMMGWEEKTALNFPGLHPI
ncbi:N-acetyl-gamma-glutamyl-phosphate reductase [Candidatus Uabimicrobium sp. HlEnr_7]|uniref:N-acetyl-gamma-glutamyl-phosphate reductase n=1 Tax=Candidatus Uabimicrobium helgolandensis TaxID=3095367 RepID=UPI003558FEF3